MRRVAITGIGLVTPLGLSAAQTWEHLLAGRSGVRGITRFDATGLPTRIAAELPDFDPERFLEPRLARTLDRFQQLGLCAGGAAIEDAGLPVKFEGELSRRAGCYVGSGMGGIETFERSVLLIAEKGARLGTTPYSLSAVVPNLLPGQLAIRHGLRGPNLAPVSACATGTHAIGEAMHLIRRGTCDVVLAGGAEAPITRVGLAAFSALRALSVRNDAPERASRPFDAGRDGFVMGEGAGVLVLEELSHALARGVRVYAEVLGYGANCDAHHITAPSAEGAAECMRLALEDAGVSPREVDHVNAHGTSTKANDVNETQALKAVLGERARSVPVAANKSMLGHLLGAAGAVETACAALSLQHGVLPPTVNQERPDPECDLDCVPNQARRAELRIVLKNSFGFGGTNACLVLGAPGE